MKVLKKWMSLWLNRFRIKKSDRPEFTLNGPRWFSLPLIDRLSTAQIQRINEVCQ